MAKKQASLCDDCKHKLFCEEQSATLTDKDFFDITKECSLYEKLDRKNYLEKAND